MSFGFSIGDFITVVDLTYKLYKAFKDAPEDFQEIRRELQSFHIVVADLKEQAEDQNSPLNRYASARRPELIAIKDNLVTIMHELEDLHGRYKQMGRISWSRFKLGQSNLVSIRSKLVVQISAVNAFVTSLNAATLGRMEPMLERIFTLLNEQVQNNSNLAQTVLSANTENGTEGPFLARLDLNLKAEGIPPEYIQENQGSIKEILDIVVELNGLSKDDSGTIIPDDSVSRVGVVQGRVDRRSSERRLGGMRTSLRKISSLGISSAQEMKSKLSPYQEWVRNLSLEQNAARIRLMNHGFDVEEIEVRRNLKENFCYAKSSFLSPFSHQSEDLSAQAVCWAATNGDQSALKLLLERGNDPFSTKEGVGAPVLVAMAGDWDAVKLLLQFGTRRKIPHSSRSLLHNAAAANRCEMITLLLDLGVDGDDTSTESKASPLHYAAEHGSFEAAELLLQRGASANRNAKGWTPLAMVVKAVEQERSVDMVKLLLENGADPNGRYGAGDRWPLLPALTSDLHMEFFSLDLPAETGAAIEDKIIHMAYLLLEAGANINSRGQKERTSLHLAATTYSNTDLAKMLMERGAAIDARDQHKQTPLHLVSRYGNTCLAKSLLEQGANVDARNEQGETPLHLASKHLCRDIVEILVENGADVNIQDKAGQTALHLAKRCWDEHLIRTLLENKADIHIQDKFGNTPLHLAVTYSNKVLVKSLIRAGADINAKNWSRKVPSALVETRSISPLIQRLLETTSNDTDEPHEHSPSCLATIFSKKNSFRNLLEERAVSQERFKRKMVQIVGRCFPKSAQSFREEASGYTPLDLGAMYSNEDLIEILVDAGADVSNSTRNFGHLSLLSLASTWDVAKLIIDKGNDSTHLHPLQRNRVESQRREYHGVLPKEKAGWRCKFK